MLHIWDPRAIPVSTQPYAWILKSFRSIRNTGNSKVHGSIVPTSVPPCLANIVTAVWQIGNVYRGLRN
jgi:hypothetical protein